jgi:hypothetical protein
MEDFTPKKIALWALFFLVLLYAVGFLATGSDLIIYRFWAPKQENARRQVFEHTQSYVDGKIQNISQQCFAYHNADGAQKEALAGEIRNEAATIDIDKLPIDAAVCVAEARRQ